MIPPTTVGGDLDPEARAHGSADWICASETMPVAIRSRPGPNSASLGVLIELPKIGTVSNTSPNEITGKVCPYCAAQSSISDCVGGPPWVPL